jgi:hypothetical protein
MAMTDDGTFAADATAQTSATATPPPPATPKDVQRGGKEKWYGSFPHIRGLERLVVLSIRENAELRERVQLLEHQQKRYAGQLQVLEMQIRELKHAQTIGFQSFN